MAWRIETIAASCRSGAKSCFPKTTDEPPAFQLLEDILSIMDTILLFKLLEERKLNVPRLVLTTLAELLQQRIRRFSPGADIGILAGFLIPGNDVVHASAQGETATSQLIHDVHLPA